MKLCAKLSILFLLNFFISYSGGYRILGVFPVPVKSHDIYCQSVMKVLAKRGHQVDVIVTRESENHPENYSIILNIADLIPYQAADVTFKDFSHYYSEDTVKIISYIFGNRYCKILANKKIQNVFQKIQKGQKYDLFVTQAFATNCFMGLAHFLKIPLITLSPQVLYPWMEDVIGNPTVTAIHPNILSPLTEINSFWDRLQNTIQKHYNTNKFRYHTEKIQTEIMREYLSADLPGVRELAKSSALTLINTHFSFNGIRPRTPALIEIGGLHISQDQSRFTPEFQKWMDESTNGVVYFTFGSTMAIESLPRELLLTFFSTFAKLKPVRFIMRVKDENKLPPGAPDNLKMLPWVPQIPILGHKNTKAFISHCGLFSSLEAVYFGVPVVGIPLFLDQFLNMHNLQKKNMAVKLKLLEISEVNLVEALTTVLSNSSFRKAAKRASKLFKDRPMSPEDTAVYWVEYVLRNGGILKSPAANLHWIQSELIDVYGFLLLSTILVIFLLQKFIRTVVNVTFEYKSRDVKDKKAK